MARDAQPTEGSVERSARYGYVPTPCQVKKRDGTDCPNWSIKGGTACVAHGGRLPSVKESAKRKKRDAVIERKIIMYGLPRDVNPHQALMDELHRTQGHVDWLENVIQNLDSVDDLIRGEVQTITRSGVEDAHNWDETTIATVENIWIRMYMRERKHLLDVSKTIIGLGLQEAMVKVHARQVQLFESVLVSVVTQLQHDVEDPAVRAAIAGGIRAVMDAAVPMELPKAK